MTDRATPIPEALRPRVLVVDDDEGYTEMWTDDLPREHAQRVKLKWVPDLDSAFRELYRDDDYHVVLLDLGLAPFHGINTYREFCKRVPNIPVIVLTGQQDAELDEQLRREGVVRTLWKAGVTPTGIVQAIFDVRLEQRQHVELQNSLARVTGEVEAATQSYRESVRRSEPPERRELFMADAHVANAEALRLFIQVMAESNRIANEALSQSRYNAAALHDMRDHGERLARVEEQSRFQQDSSVDLREQLERQKETTQEAHRLAATRQWLSEHKVRVISIIVGAIVSLGLGWIAAHANQPIPKPAPIAPPAVPQRLIDPEPAQ